MTDQRPAELIRLIETVRQQDRKQIVAALEQIEQAIGDQSVSVAA